MCVVSGLDCRIVFWPIFFSSSRVRQVYIDTAISFHSSLNKRERGRYVFKGQVSDIRFFKRPTDEPGAFAVALPRGIYVPPREERWRFCWRGSIIK